MYYYYRILIILCLSFYMPKVIAEATLTSALTHGASDKKKLLWLVEDKQENLGLMDRTAPNNSAATATERHVIFHLEGYEIEVQRLTIKRINYLMQSRPNACVANRAKLPEREAYSIFSNPQSFYLTHKLYRYNQTSPMPELMFNKENELISLGKLFEHQVNKRIGLVEGVSYGSFLDAQVKTLDKANTYYRNGSQRVVALESMLYLNRLDYLLALPVDMTPTQEQEAKLEQYDIAGAPKFVIAHFSCSKNEFGQQVINDINKILMKTYEQKLFYTINEKWYSNTDLQFIQSYLQDNYLNSIK